MKVRPNSLVAVGLVVLGVALAIVASNVGFFQGPAPSPADRGAPAPEFVGIDGWLNSSPLTVGGLRGSVVLIDFWTYSCVNCARTWPHLRQIYARYKPAGLEIVGVHSPEFSFEKISTNVQDAIDRNDLTWPVALDNDMETWRAYRNNSWPHVYIIDAKGVLRFDAIGEGNEELIQDRLRSLLRENGATLPEPIDFKAGAFNPHQTPEIYAGYRRGEVMGALGNPEGYLPNRVLDYRDVDDQIVTDAGTNGVFFLEGAWRAHAEYVEAVEDGARVRLPFYARDVFFVAAPASGSVEVRLRLDGRAVSASLLGADAAGGVVRIDRSDLFRLLTLDEADTHELTIEADEGFRLYTFTFG